MNVFGKATHFSASSLLFFLLLSNPATCLATDVTLAWDPSPDADLAGYRIYYQANSSAIPFQGSGATEGNAPVDKGKSTTASISGLNPANSYFFAVTAYNSAGAESVYSNIVQIPETLAPSVSITSPQADTTVAGAVAFSASATDNAGIAKVQFLLNGTQVYETATAPYTYSWDTTPLSAGSYALTAKAFDISGNEALSQSVTVSVAGDQVSPTVSLQAPPADATVGGAINLSASATDNTGVTRLELSVDGAVVLSGNQSPVSYVWNTAAFTNGSHLVSAKAYDAAGNAGAASATVLIYNSSSTPTTTTPTTTTPTTTTPTTTTPTTTTPTTTTPTTTQPTGSLALTLADAQLALQIAAGQLSPTSTQLQRLDLAPYLNGQPQPNGKVDTGDVVVILALLTGKL